MEPELLPFGSFTHRIISQVLASVLREEYQVTSPDDGGIGGIWNRNKEEEMLKKVEMGENFVGVYRKACSEIPLAVGFVGRDRQL